MALYHVYNQTVADGTATSVVRPSDWNSAHGQTQVLSGNTVGASTVSGTNVVFQGGDNVTLSAAQGANQATVFFHGQTNALTTAALSNHSHGNPTLALTNLSGTTASASNGLTISLSAAAPGGGGAATYSSYIPEGMYPASTASQTLGAMGVTSGSAMFWPFHLKDAVQFDHVMLGMNLSYATSSVSGQQTISFSYGLYSNNVSTLSMISSNSFSMGISGSSGSATVNLPMTTNTSGWGYDTTSGSASAQLQSLFGTAGVKLLELQFGNTMSLNAGQYWFGVQKRYSSSSANIGISLGMQGNVFGPIVSRAPIGQQSSAQTTNPLYKQPLQGMGPYTSTGSAGYGGTALPTSVFITGIAHTMSIYPCLTFDKSL